MIIIDRQQTAGISTTSGKENVIPDTLQPPKTSKFGWAYGWCTLNAREGTVADKKSVR